MLYDYLLNNPDIGNLVTGDIHDVVFDNDLFEIMAKLGDYYYTSYDIPLIYSIRWSISVATWYV